MPEFSIWLLSFVALVLGGVIKGALGVGLPLIAVPILSLWLPTGRAIGLLSVPVLWSNLVQARGGAGLMAGWRRFRGLILTQFFVTIVTVRLTTDLPAQVLNILVAGAVLFAVAMMSVQTRLVIAPKHEFGLGIAVGALAGLLGGASSLTGPVVITYFLALRLPRDEFVRSISLIYLIGSLPIYGAMLWFGRIGWMDVGLSVLALLPVYLGMRLGMAVRQRLDEALFRRIVLVFLVVVAAMLLMKG